MSDLEDIAFEEGPLRITEMVSFLRQRNNVEREDNEIADALEGQAKMIEELEDMARTKTTSPTDTNPGLFNLGRIEMTLSKEPTNE